MRGPLKCLKNCSMLLRAISYFFFSDKECALGLFLQHKESEQQVRKPSKLNNWSVKKGLITYCISPVQHHWSLPLKKLFAALFFHDCIINKKKKTQRSFDQSVIVPCCHRKQAWLCSSSFHISPGSQIEFSCCIQALISNPSPQLSPQTHLHTYTHACGQQRSVVSPVTSSSA